ncbi:AGAP010839-PA [Anopheles gambiae str. PEST]|uniref:AGAP010839-PA n=3 Tax=gambiae species complex TaxID=44542 RepID=Q5TVM3_ANOGA|nr:AGAP010839-PA [Anopheles gambiae str. PEST]
MVEPIKPLPSDTSLMEGEENVEPMPQLAPMLPPKPMSFSHSPAAAAAAGSSSMLARSPGVANSTSIGNTTRGGSRRLKPAAKNCPIIF